MSIILNLARSCFHSFSEFDVEALPSRRVVSTDRFHRPLGSKRNEVNYVAMTYLDSSFCMKQRVHIQGMVESDFRTSGAL